MSTADWGLLSLVLIPMSIGACTLTPDRFVGALMLGCVAGSLLLLFWPVSAD